MSELDLGRLLAELPVPASAEARERTVAAARAAAPPRRRPRRRPAAAGAAVLLALALASPPGQAAIERVGELVGIGDVGEPPTLGPPAGVIVDNGRAPDGTGYEWTAYRAGSTYEEGGMQVPVEESCLRLDWPADPGRTSGFSCSAVPDSSRGPFGRNYFSSHEIRRLPSGDVMLNGVTTREPHALRISFEGRELDVDFARVENELLERGGAKEPFGVFVAFVPAAEAAPLDRYRDVGLIFPVVPGPPVEPDPSQPPECRYEAPPGPFEFRFFGRDGELIDRVPTIVGRIAPPGCKP